MNQTTLVGGLAIISAIYLAAKYIESRINQHRLIKLREQSNVEQQTYLDEVNKLTEEINNAKLTFDINKRKLTNDTTGASKD